MSKDSTLFGISQHVCIPQGADRIEGLRAAAAAALKALADSGRSTVLFEDSLSDGDGPADAEAIDSNPDKEQDLSTSMTADAAPAKEAAPTKVAGSPKGSADNPLAAFLGTYSDDESAGSEDPAQEVTAPAAPAQQAAQANTAAGNQMDDELSKFMQELESSGLLDDSIMSDAAAAAADAAAAAAAAVNGDSPAAAGGEAAPAASSTHDPSSPAGPSTAATDEQGQPAEQRTLGMLAAAPDWYKVLDTGSGRAYFWNVSSNEVLWEPPEGIDGSTLLPVKPEDGAAAKQELPDANEEAATTGAGSLSIGADAAGAAGPSSGASPAASHVAVHGDQPEHKAVQAPALAKPDAAAVQSPTSSPQPQAAETPVHAAAVANDMAAAAGGHIQSSSTDSIPRPQQDIQPVFSTLLAELQAVAEVQQLLKQLPDAVKLLLQLQVLQEQWSVFAARQAAAATGRGDGSNAFTWLHYEQYIMQQLQHAAQQLQPMLQAVQRQGGEQEPADHAGPVVSLIAVKAVQQQCPEKTEQQQQPRAQDGSQDDAEEGEVGPSSSSDEGEDMDMDLENSPVKAAVPPVAASKPGKKQQLHQTLQGAPPATEQQVSHRMPSNGGVYASTTHMPVWARPNYHYSFAGHDASAAASYSAPYPSVGYEYSMPAYSQHYGYGSYTHGYATAGTSEVVHAGADRSTPPLPADEPPPLPDEAPPEPPEGATLTGSITEEHTAGAATVAGACSTAAATTSSDVTASHAAKRQKVVVAPAVHRAAVAASAVAAGSTDDSPAYVETAEFATGGSTGGSSSSTDGRKRSRDQRQIIGSAVTAAVPASATGTKVKKAKVNALLNKWASVRQQQQLEEEQRQQQLEQEADPEYWEAKRQRELEQWSKQQMALGAEDNPNFTPVAGDWRARLGLAGGAGTEAASAAAETPEERAARKAAKKAAKAAKKAAAAAVASSDSSGSSMWPSSMKTKPDLAALSVGLPAGWVAMFEHDTKKGIYNIYYGNPETKETSWDRP